MSKASKVLIIGGGIVGSACAYYLALEGADVTLVERTDIGAEASGAGQGFVDWASGLSRDTLSFVYESIQLLKSAAKDLGDFSLTLDGYLMVAAERQLDGRRILAPYWTHLGETGRGTGLRRSAETYCQQRLTEGDRGRHR